MGYGTYTFLVTSDLRNLDPSVVLGLFTYDPRESRVGNSEIDIEAAKWGNAGDPNNADYSIQPTDPDPKHRMKRVRLGAPPYVARFIWAKDHVAFSVTDASGDEHNFIGTHLPAPPAKTTQAVINLWLYDNKAPADGQPMEIVLSSFSHHSQRPR